MGVASLNTGQHQQPCVHFLLTFLDLGMVRPYAGMLVALCWMNFQMCQTWDPAVYWFIEEGSGAQAFRLRGAQHQGVTMVVPMKPGRPRTHRCSVGEHNRGVSPESPQQVTLLDEIIQRSEQQQRCALRNESPQQQRHISHTALEDRGTAHLKEISSTAGRIPLPLPWKRGNNKFTKMATWVRNICMHTNDIRSPAGIRLLNVMWWHVLLYVLFKVPGMNVLSHILKNE